MAYSLSNQGVVGYIPGWYMHVMFMTNVHADVIDHPSGGAFFKISQTTADTDFANSALFSLNAK